MFLYSYDRSYVLKVDDEGEIRVKKKNYTFNKRKRKENETRHPIPRMKKILSDEVCHGFRAKTCCSLNCCQHFPHEMMILLKQELWKKSFENQTLHSLDILKRLHGRGSSCAKFVTIKERYVCKTAWYKIMGISCSTYMSY